MASTTKSSVKSETGKPKRVAAKKAADAPTVAPKAAAAIEKPATRRKSTAKGAAISDQQRRNYVEVAAYYIAERRGFQGGDALDDWAQAERDVERMLGDKRFSR